MAMPPDDIPDSMLRTIASCFGLAMALVGLVGVLHRKLKRRKARKARARAHAKSHAQPNEADLLHPATASSDQD